MRRVIISIIAIFVLLGAVASDTQRTNKARTNARTSTKKKKAVKKAPVINTDSIEAAYRTQLRLDSINNLKARVDSGDISAINELGMWYYTGHIVDQDYYRAVELWRKSADASSARGLANLGMCYELGHGVVPNEAEAAKLYVMSIKCGNGTLFKQKLDSASNNVVDALLIGECYEHGEGVKPDLSRAADLYANAAALGSDTGVCRAALCYLASGDTLRALEYLPKGASLGDVACKYWIGKLTLDGYKSDLSDAQAVSFIMDASDASMAEAQNEAATILSDGTFVPKDLNRALTLFRLSAQSGYVPAMYNYAIALSEGEGTEPDYDSSLYWFAQADKAGHDVDLAHLIGSDDSAWGCYVRGLRAFYIENDYAAAAKLMKLSEKIGKNIAPKVMQSVILADSSNPKSKPTKAVKDLERMLEQSPQAAYYLAEIYDSGRNGVPRDTQRAQWLYKKAEDGGYLTDLSGVISILTKTKF